MASSKLRKQVNERAKAYQYVPTINYESFFNQQLWGEKAIVL